MKRIDNIQFCIENGYITNKFYMILLMKTVDLHQNFNNLGPKVPLYFQDLPKFWTFAPTHPVPMYFPKVPTPPLVFKFNFFNN